MPGIATADCRFGVFDSDPEVSSVLEKATHLNSVSGKKSKPSRRKRQARNSDLLRFS